MATRDLITASANSFDENRAGPVTRAIRAMQAAHDSCRSHFFGEPEPPLNDADLLDLGRRYDRILKACDDALARWAALDDMVPEIEPPEAIFAKGGDEDFGFLFRATVRHDDRRWYYLALDGSADVALRRRQPNARAQARADEIVTAWDGWRAEIAASEAAVGIPPVQAEMRRLGVEREALAQRIEAATARTVEGLKVKARFAQAEIDMEDTLTDAFVRGFVRDVLALA